MMKKSVIAPDGFLTTRHSADKFNVDFINRYDELAMGIFGEARLESASYSDTRLEPIDFQSYDYDQTKKLYIYDNQTYQFEWPIFEQMLERKKESRPNFKSASEITKHEL